MTVKIVIEISGEDVKVTQEPAKPEIPNPFDLFNPEEPPVDTEGPNPFAA